MLFVQGPTVVRKGKRWADRMVQVISSKGSCPCPSLHLSIFPVSQVQIHSTYILALWLLAFFLSFALANYIPCYIVSFSNKSKQKALRYPPTDHSKARVLQYFSSKSLSFSRAVTDLSAVLLTHAFSKPRLQPLAALHRTSGAASFAAVPCTKTLSPFG